MRRVVSVLVGLLVAGGASVVWAQDPVKVGPNVYSVKFENDKVRVSEIDFDPDESIPMHSHPDHFVYVLTEGTLQLSYPDGKTSDFSATPGQVVWLPAETHAAINTGTTQFKALVVELKPLPNYEAE